VDIPQLIRFRLGTVVITPGALAALQECDESPWKFLTRHLAGDWGDLDAFDKQQNELALQDGDRLLSAYTTVKSQRLYVITEADRSATTILLPDEY